MREIKFRAWDRAYKEMLQVGMLEWYCNLSGRNHDTKMAFVKGKPFVRTKINFEEYQGGDVEERFELMQYTGLKDKNGKEIYEGDILKDTYGLIKIKEMEEGTFTYTDDKNNLGGVFPIDYSELKNCEIIGNIYENKELLTL